MRVFIIISFLLSPAAARAETIVASVNGMVCSMCVSGIEKSFKKVDAVAGVKVDLESKQVTLQIKDGAQIDDARVTQTIVNAGYTVTGISRTR